MHQQAAGLDFSADRFALVLRICSTNGQIDPAIQ
jgi:hypothetical protein